MRLATNYTPNGVPIVGVVMGGVLLLAFIIDAWRHRSAPKTKWLCPAGWVVAATGIALRSAVLGVLGAAIMAVGYTVINLARMRLPNPPPKPTVVRRKRPRRWR